MVLTYDQSTRKADSDAVWLGGTGVPPVNHAQDARATLKLHRYRKGERGNVMIMTAIFAVGLVLAVGLCIDGARIYMTRAELQNAADAAALAAARELNSGTGGLTDAVTQAKAAALQTNKYGLNRTGSTAPAVTISTVEFAADLNGPWYIGAGGVPSGTEASIRYVRVTTQTTNTPVLFAVRALGNSHAESRSAVAGMSAPINVICDLFPIAAALTPANQNLTAGQQITLAYGGDDVTGSSATVNDHTYVVIQVDDGFGGHVGSIQLAAGIPDICVTLGQTRALDSSQAANKKNGRDAIAKGANTRFDDPVSYSGGSGGGGLDPAVYPPDLNIQQGLTFTQYLAGSPSTGPSHTGQPDRRILVMPIINTLPAGSSPTVTINTFGVFLLKNKVSFASACGAGSFCGADLQLEYLGHDFVVGRGGYDPGVGVGGCTDLALPVLYK